MPILPNFDAANFEPSAPIDNPYLPFDPGTVATYGGTGPDGTESDDVFTTFETKTIDGVETVVVRDTAYLDGVLAEDTLDWYAQDDAGNVWYMGELTYAYEYDDDGKYVGASSEGSWTAGVEGALPGWAMPAHPGFGAGYYQEYDPGVAVDEGVVVGVNQSVATGLDGYDGVLRTLDTTALEPDVAEFKYYAPGVGQILTEEELTEAGVPQLAIELQAVREVAANDVSGDGGDEQEGGSDGEDGAGIALGDLADKQALAGVEAVDEPQADDFPGDGSDVYVTFLGETAGYDNAIGAYTFDAATGAIGEGRILFAGTDEVTPGETATVQVAAGESLGLFMVADGGNLGIDLADYEAGGLYFQNFNTGGPATIADGLAPLVTNADGEVLPLPVFHALGNDDGFNFLNPAAGVQGVELESGFVEDDLSGDVSILGFEDQRATSERFDGDYNDVVIAVGDVPLSASTRDGLLGELAGDPLMAA